MAILFFFYVFCFLFFPRVDHKMLITATRYEYRTHSYLAYTACVCLCVCVGMCVLQWHFHAPCNKHNERGVDDVEEEEELGPQWRKGVVNAQKRLQPQSRPEANLA